MEIKVVREVLLESNNIGKENRAVFDKNSVFTVNLIGSPGSGKTSILKSTIPILRELGYDCAVIEGDITSTIDSEKLKPLNIQVVQVNTAPFGGDCHVGANFVQAALKHIDLSSIQFLFIENIGNLVCPAEFYLGEDCKVAVLSLTEGEDKPLKYPLIFRESRLCLLTKHDLLPYIDIDLDTLKHNIHMINSELEIITTSSRINENISNWVGWLEANYNSASREK
ncbi:MAG: hydrogenase nickel incorporation protein HypB [Candidatus Marinimicrobia bacterium]|nr:hydrogenase nickel incorporation protein HypB [Candidatus Neomarinimicrobiota bacterium]